MAKNYVGKHRPSNVKLTVDDIRRMLEMKARLADRRSTTPPAAAA
jgi:hypothetical protein